MLKFFVCTSNSRQKDRQLSEKDEQMRIKDRQIAEKDKTVGPTATVNSSSHEGSRSQNLELDQAKEASKKKAFALTLEEKIKKLFGLLTNLKGFVLCYEV